MPNRGASLRTVVGTVVAVVSALALATAGALVFLTSEIRRTAEDLRAVTEAVRIAEDATIDLLLHDRTDDPLARREMERRLREKLTRAAELTTSDLEGEALANTVQKVNAYFARASDADALEAAFVALDELLAASARRSHEADARAKRLDDVGNAIGVATAVLLVLSAGWLLWWLRTRAFEPLLTLAEAMERFGGGDAGARASEQGPAELREMARRFNEMAAALAALRARQLTFVAAIAHDLRNPLSALKLATRPGTASERGSQDATLPLIRRQVLRLERLVSDFLDTTRIEAGQLAVHPEPVDLRPIVENVVSLFGATSEAHRITARVPEEQVIAPCDPGRLEQVLNNLVSNAIKYSPKGGRIDVHLTTTPDAVSVSVADEGVGIQEGDAEAIFEPFRRGGSVQHDIPGVGLGLYVSRRIVEAHGGHIHVSSSPGQGSTFEVVLPR